MKIRVRYILLIGFAVLALRYIASPMVKTNKLAASVQTQTVSTLPDFKIVNSATALNHGGIGFITVQGHPGVKYTIKTSYSLTTGNYNVTQWRIADGSGLATFIWHVSPDTILGTNKAIITDGEKFLELAHTVLQ